MGAQLLAFEVWAHLGEAESHRALLENRAGAAVLSNFGPRKADVVRMGHALAREDGVEHVILKKTGEIQRRTTYQRNRLRHTKG